MIRSGRDENRYDQILALKIAQHCAPVLMAVKPANTMSVSREEVPAILRLTAATGVSVAKLAMTGKKILLLFYREELLMQQLSGKEEQVFLCRYGYSGTENIQQVLIRLIRRFYDYRKGRTEFPHELGVLLGYPVEDMEGFLEHGGKNCRLTGYWKVYGDVERAKEIFTSYDRAKNRVKLLLNNGMELADITKRSRIA